MTAIYSTAAEVISASPRGAVVMMCTLAEAFRLSGAKTTDVHGMPAWYGVPSAFSPGQPKDRPGLWTIGVNRDKTANAEVVQAALDANRQWLDTGL